jgi:hypothetical protein
MKMGLKELRTPDGRVYATIYFDTALNATVDVWTGPFGHTLNLKKGLMLVLDNIKQHRSKKWLADISLMEGNFDLAKNFIAQHIIPKAMDLGLRCEALVLPHNVFAMVSVQETGLQMINHFELRMFATVQEAKDWLHLKEF